MAKSFTSLEQSKKLAEILPIESADMSFVSCDDGRQKYYQAENRKIILNYEKNHWLPCWSLAALLNILPNNENISINLSKGGFRISTLKHTNDWFVDYEDESDGLNNCVTSADNPIDACVAMILKLHELNLL